MDNDRVARPGRLSPVSDACESLLRVKGPGGGGGISADSTCCNDFVGLSARSLIVALLSSRWVPIDEGGLSVGGGRRLADEGGRFSTADGGRLSAAEPERVVGPTTDPGGAVELERREEDWGGIEPLEPVRETSLAPDF